MVKHVVMIHERFPPDYAGGGEYVVHQMAKHLQARGIRITVLTTGDPEQTEFDGIKTIRIPCSVYAFNLKASVLLPYCHDADVIQAFTYHSVIPATRVASTLNIPLVKMMLALFGKEWRIDIQSIANFPKVTIANDHRRFNFSGEADRVAKIQIKLKPAVVCSHVCVRINSSRCHP